MLVIVKCPRRQHSFTHLQTLSWKPIPKPCRQVLKAFRFVVKCVLKDEKQVTFTYKRNKINHDWASKNKTHKNVNREMIILANPCCHRNRWHQVAWLILVPWFYESTHRSDVGLHGQQVEESKELNGEDGVNLRGGEHQHSQWEQHFEIRWVSPPLHRSVINVHNSRHKWPHTAACKGNCGPVCCCHT